jgi:hypothetical protein
VICIPIPERKSPAHGVVGYVVRPKGVADFSPAFNVDLTRAVSMCRQRINKAVLGEMDL